MRNAQMLEVRDYLRAAAHVYGRITLGELYSVFTLHNGDRLTAERFYQLAREAEAPDEWFRILGDDDIYRADISVRDMDRCVVHRQYCYATWDALLTLECNQEGKPIRRFPKEKLLAYADPGYIPNIPQVRSLLNLLQQYSRSQQPDIRLLQRALELARNDCNAPSFLQELQRLGCSFDTMEDRLGVAQCYKEIYDFVPKAIHCGHSELEMQLLMPETKRVRRYAQWFCPPGKGDAFCMDAGLLTEDAHYTGETEHRRFLERCMMEQAFPPRLQEPCPCGSGLDYEHCCGKR